MVASISLHYIIQHCIIQPIAINVMWQSHSKLIRIDSTPKTFWGIFVDCLRPIILFFLPQGPVLCYGLYVGVYLLEITPQQWNLSPKSRESTLNILLAKAKFLIIKFIRKRYDNILWFFKSFGSPDVLLSALHYRDIIFLICRVNPGNLYWRHVLFGRF